MCYLRWQTWVSPYGSRRAAGVETQGLRCHGWPCAEPPPRGMACRCRGACATRRAATGGTCGPSSFSKLFGRCLGALHRSKGGFSCAFGHHLKPSEASGAPTKRADPGRPRGLGLGHALASIFRSLQASQGIPVPFKTLPTQAGKQATGFCFNLGLSESPAPRSWPRSQ